MANLSSLVGIQTLATSIANLILVTPQSDLGYQPQNGPAAQQADIQLPPTLLFQYEGEQTVTFESDITDNFVEDNTAVQDQISLKPEVITVKGFIGELNDVVPRALQPLKTAADKLTAVEAYTPALTAAALIAYNQAFAAYQTAQLARNAAVSAWSSINGDGQRNQSKQALAFQQFYGYWASRTLFTVQTPWGVFEDCAILRVKAVQDADTNTVSEFDVTFKLMRFASTTEIDGAFISPNFLGRANDQASPATNLGTSTPRSGLGSAEALASFYPGVV